MSGWSFGTYPDPQSHALQRTRAWLGDTDETWLNLYLYGDVGAGKTGLAWSAMMAFLETSYGEEVDFVNVRSLLAEARRSFGDKDVSDPLDELLGRLPAINLLVLDDLGAERPTEWALEVIANIIEARYLRERLTIVTTNFAPSRLVTRLRPRDGDRETRIDDVIGKRIVSRITDRCLQVPVTGPDWRVRPEAA